MADASPDIDVVIPTWNGRDLLHGCLEAVARTRGDLRLRVIVVDNASTDGSPDLVRRSHPEVELLQNEVNQGFARACNRGAAAGTAPFILLLNSDAVLQPAALERLLRCLQERPRAAMAAPQFRHSDGTFQSSHGPFPTLGQELLVLSGIGRLAFGAHYPSREAEVERGPQRAEWVGGACVLIRRAAWSAMGGLDEGYFMYAEEVDLSYRLSRAGWEVWYEPVAVVYHVGGGSARQIRVESEARLYTSRVRFHRVHHGPVQAALVQSMIFVATALKIPMHAVLRAASRGRWGRQVVSLRALRAELRRS